MKMIALFFPALISISIYARRRHIKLDLDVRLWIRYAVYVVAVNWCNMSLTTYVFGIDDSKLMYMENWPFFTKYVFIAILLACGLPYLVEVAKKYFCISVRIESTEVSHEGD